jgi:hypothetical protein
VFGGAGVHLADELREGGGQFRADQRLSHHVLLSGGATESVNFSARRSEHFKDLESMTKGFSSVCLALFASLIGKQNIRARLRIFYVVCRNQNCHFLRFVDCGKIFFIRKIKRNTVVAP